jgi:hypothetical protein
VTGIDWASPKGDRLQSHENDLQAFDRGILLPTPSRVSRRMLGQNPETSQRPLSKVYQCENSKTKLEKVVAKISDPSKFSIGLPHGQKKVFEITHQ